VQRKPADRDARVLQGKLFWQGQQYAKAADAMEAAYKLDTTNVETGFMAVVAAGKIAGEDGLRKQAALLREILVKNPGNEHAVRLLALTLGALGDNGAQEALYQEVRDSAAATEVDLQTTFGVWRAIDRGLPEAEEMLRKARAAAPDSGDTAAALGFVLNLQGQSEAAEEALAKAIELNTGVAGLVKLQLGMIYLQTGKYEKALTVFNGAKGELKDDPRLPFYTALALELTGLGTEALVEYERISTGSSQFAGPASLQMAALYLKQSLPDKALAAVRRATELGVSSARLFTVQGQVQAQQGMQAEAEQSYRRAVQTDANYPGAHLELGLMMVSRNAVPEGLRELERYLEVTAENPAGTPRRNEIELLVNQLKQTQTAS
jgi:tetratricopeptide (TPR) repeat protein